MIKCLLLAPSEILQDHLRVGLQLRNVQLITPLTEVQFGSLASDATFQILRTIESADAIIADISEANPNIMYEVGFAHALKKPVLPIVRRGSEGIPSVLTGYLYYSYDLNDGNWDKQLTMEVDRWLQRTLRETYT